MPMNFPDTPTNGATFTSGASTWVWNSTPGAWKAAGASAGSPPLYLPLAGGQLTPNGLLIGAAGTVPGGGLLTLNANTGAPASPQSTNIYVVPADNANGAVGLDSYGTSATNYLVLRRSRGTAVAPTAIQAFDWFGAVAGFGHNGSAYVGNAALVALAANENWTTSANGSRIDFQTIPNGTTSAVTSLTLSGNNATFPSSGALIIGCRIRVNGDSGSSGGYFWFTGTNTSPEIGAFGLVLNSSQQITQALLRVPTNIYVAGTGGNDPFLINADSNVSARVKYSNPARTWTSGVWQDGRFSIGDESAGQLRLIIDTGGVVYLSRTIHSWNCDPSANNTQSVGIPGQAWSNMCSYAFSNQSDMRDKQHVRAPEAGALAQVCALKPVEFHWKDPKETRGVRVGSYGPQTEQGPERPVETDDSPYHRGFLAQDVRKIMGPKFAGWAEENGHQSIVYSELTAVLWQAVQELTDEVALLKAKI